MIWRTGRIKRIHCIGIGGSGLSGIAEVLHNIGFSVSGSDIKESETVKRLVKLGIPIKIGHSPENVQNADLIVYSSAIQPNNPEILEGRRQKIPIISRAEMLAELMRVKTGIAIAGAHGKTTTTSMISFILNYAGYDPTVIIGGRLKSFGSSARLGKGEFFVAEADESDKTFLKIYPTIAVITNIDREHLNCYRDFEELKSSFLTYANSVPFYGTIFACLDNKYIQEILPMMERKVVTYGFTPQANFVATNLRLAQNTSIFTLNINNERVGEFKLRIPGEHNVLNSLAAIAVSNELEIKMETIASALEQFPGADRRFEIKGIFKNIMIVDDYGHHPAEVYATLDSAKKGWGRRLVLIFQPHRYTRLADLMIEFARVFLYADVVIITKIYPASEKPIEGVSSERLAEITEDFGHKNVHYIEELEDIPEFVLGILQDNDIVITMGAGDIYKVADMLTERLKNE
ncbi:MAG: UDP-N-acetylmuramate--L-alanine ligase [Candidatus Aminicenantia bacterium]